MDGKAGNPEAIFIRRGVPRLLFSCFHRIAPGKKWYKRILKLPAFEHGAVGSCIDYSQYLDWAIFQETNLSKDELKDFLPLSLQELVAYDKSYGTEYLRTLTVYIEQGCNQKKAADALATHINTINYGDASW